MANTKPQVVLEGIDGNAFMVLGVCLKAAKKAGKSKEWQDKVMSEMKSGDYDHLLQTAMKYFDVEEEEEEGECGECGSELNDGSCEDCDSEDEEDEEDE